MPGIIACGSLVSSPASKSNAERRASRTQRTATGNWTRTNAEYAELKKREPGTEGNGTGLGLTNLLVRVLPRLSASHPAPEVLLYFLSFRFPRAFLSPRLSASPLDMAFSFPSSESGPRDRHPRLAQRRGLLPRCALQRGDGDAAASACAEQVTAVCGLGEQK